MELTILMPCLNEAETLETCIIKAKKFLSENNIDGEILISDNGSTDGSIQIAERLGARVVHASEKGYGSALIVGTKAAYGKYVIMGDADDSYDFLNLMPFVQKLREGYDLVMGNRFKGGIEKGAMPWSHRYIGNPILSFIGRLFFKSNIKDFHCGLRGYNKEKILALGLHTTGMEYASEMVVMAELAKYKICEVATTLKKDGRSRPPHLRSFRDGWRHLKFLFMYSPRWLFLYPRVVISALGIIGAIILLVGQFKIGSIIFSIHTLLYCSMAIVVGVTIIYFYIFTKLYAEKSHFIPHDKTIDKFVNFGENKGILVGVGGVITGIVIAIIALIFWKNNNYGEVSPEILMRFVIPSATLIELGIVTIFASFFMGILRIEWRNDDGKGN